MPGIAVVFIIVAVLLLSGSSYGIYKFSGHKMTYSRRQQQWNDVLRPRMNAQHDAQKVVRHANREAMIRGHWDSRIKRAERRAKGGNPKQVKKAADLNKMADREVKLDRRMHGLDPTANKRAKAHMPKIHPKTGHITGGIGREGTKASHAHNPQPKRVMQSKKPKSGKTSQVIKKSLKDIIIGDLKKRKGRK